MGSEGWKDLGGGDRRKTLIMKDEDEMGKKQFVGYGRLVCLLYLSSRCLSLPICEVWVIMSLSQEKLWGSNEPAGVKSCLK